MEEEEEIESSSDAEDEDHQNLLQQVESVTKRSRVEQRTEGALVASEHHLTSAAGQAGEVTLQSLLTGLSGVESKSLLDLKKRLSTVEERSGAVEPPLNKIEADRANRRAANEETCKDVSKWDPIVKKNREADHLSFPIQQEHIPPPSLSTKLESFTPTTELEKEVAAILASSPSVEEEGEELTEAEKKSLLQMTLEEVLERKKALRKHRALVSYYEQKCRRVGRIKSKKFHRMQRKRQERLGNKPPVADEELMKLRAKERMTLKHSSRAKWARKQHLREHRDPATQQALSEHHNKKIQLKEKVMEQGDSGEEGEEEEDEDEGGGMEEGSRQLSCEEPITVGYHDNPWLNSSGTNPKVGNGSKRIASSSGLIDTSSFMVDGRNQQEGSGFKAASKQLLAVREAFAGDNVVEEFEREKAEVEARETVDDTPVTLPGWGSWGGEGVRPPKKKPKVKPRLPRKWREDSGMKHVIIPEEQRNRKIVEHLVSSVPWPFASKDQFDKTHCTPVGRLWNTESTFQHLIKPRVNTFSGEIIEPLQLTEEVESFIKRKGKKKGRAKSNI